MSDLFRAQDYKGKTVLIAGGTRGIGLATGIEFARHGAQVCLTHYWASRPDEEVIAEFKKYGPDVLEPKIFSADISNEEDTDILLNEIKKFAPSIDMLLISASSLLRTKSLEDYKKYSFLKTMEYGAWPLVSYTLKIKNIFGKFPRYIFGLTTRTQNYNRYYDFHASSKAALEIMVRHLAYRLQKENCSVNLICPPYVETEAPYKVFGKNFSELFKKVNPTPSLIMKPEQVALAIYGLSSGYLDIISGQCISLDGGGYFVDNTMGILDNPEILEVFEEHFKLSAKDE